MGRTIESICLAFHRTRIKVVPYYQPLIIYVEFKLLSITQEKDPKEITQQSPLYSFMYALKSSEARRQFQVADLVIYIFFCHFYFC